MSMWSDFFSKLKKEDLVAKASLAEREAEVLRKAQEIVNEYSKVAGIEPPTVRKDTTGVGYHASWDDNTIGVCVPHALRSDERELRGILAHEVGHLQGVTNEQHKEYRETRQKESNKKLAVGVPLCIAGAMMAGGNISFDLAPQAQLFAALAAGGFGGLIAGGTPESERIEESRADQFAVEKCGMDPIVMMKIQLDAMRNRGLHNEKPSLIPLAITEFESRGPSRYLKEAFKERLAELGSDAKLPFRVPSRYAQPAEPKKVETSSTGRITGGGRFSHPPSPEAIAQARQEPPPRARSSGRSM